MVAPHSEWPEAAVARLAAFEERVRSTRHGAFSRHDARSAGLAESEIKRLVAQRRWRPSGVAGWLVIADCWDMPNAHLSAAVSGLDGVAWRRSSLALHGLREHPETPQVLTRRRYRGSAVDVSRYEMNRWKQTEVAGIATIALPDAIASMAGSYGGFAPGYHGRPGEWSSDRSGRAPWPADVTRRLEWFDELIDQALLSRRTTWPELEATFRRVRRQGRAGSALLGVVLEERRDEQRTALSTWSRRFVRALDAAGLPTPTMEWQVTDNDRFIAQVDLAYPDLRYAIELDSLSYHLNPEAFERDRRRDGELSIVGWTVRRFTWRQYDEAFPWVLNIVQSDLARLSPRNSDR